MSSAVPGLKRERSSVSVWMRDKDGVLCVYVSVCVCERDSEKERERERSE